MAYKKVAVFTLNGAVRHFSFGIVVELWSFCGETIHSVNITLVTVALLLTTNLVILFSSLCQQNRCLLNLYLSCQVLYDLPYSELLIFHFLSSCFFHYLFFQRCDATAWKINPNSLFSWLSPHLSTWPSLSYPGMWVSLECETVKWSQQNPERIIGLLLIALFGSSHRICRGVRPTV